MTQQAQQEGSLRLLTLGEIKLAKSVFGNSIPYHKCGSIMTVTFLWGCKAITQP